MGVSLHSKTLVYPLFIIILYEVQQWHKLNVMHILVSDLCFLRFSIIPFKDLLVTANFSLSTGTCI